MSLPTPKAVIFDWDNTLVNTWPIIHDAINGTFAEMGKPLWTFEQTKMRVRKSMRDSFPEIFGEKWQEAGKIYQGHYRANHLKKLEALPQAADVLERVKALDIYSLVVSNKKGVNLREEVRHIGWGHYFDSVVGSDDAARDKPHPDPVHHAFADLHIKPNESVWFIGDSDIDLECAMNCGCTAILYGDFASQQTGYTATHFNGYPFHAHAISHTQTLQLLPK